MKTSCFLLLSFLFATIKLLFAQQPPAPMVISSYTKNLPPVFLGYNGNNVIGKDDNDNFLSFSIDELRKTLPQLHTTLIRFPAGGKSKSWDWNAGWHLDDEVFAYGNTIPNHIGNYCVKLLDDEAPPLNGGQYQGNQLTALKGAWNIAGASFMIPLNMISSNKDYQLEQVRQAYKLMKRLTINDTVFVELGNEVYNKADPALKCLFAEPEDYLVVANEYLDALHSSSFLSGENIKVSVGVVAAANSVQDKSLTLDCHYNTWNAELGLPYYATAGNDRLHLGKDDGLIFHIYPESGLTAVAMGIPAATATNADILFQVALNNIDKMKENELKAVPPGINAWITEFNLTDEKSVYVRGTWAHGLFTALQTLTFLEAPSVSKINCHDLINDSGRSSVFSKSTGFDYATDCSALAALTTGAYKLTAQGMALSMVAEAMKKSTKAQQIDFAGESEFSNYTFANGRCKLYGWQFTKKDATNAEYNETIILNLGGTQQAIRLSGLYSNPSNSIVYESIYPEDGQPFIYVTNDATPGEAYTVSSACVSTQSNLTISGYSVYNNELILRPYTIVHIKRADLASSSVAVYPAKTIDVCSGESVNIFVSGAASYKWINESTSSFTLLDETGVVVNNSYGEASVVVSNVTASGTITLKPKNKNGTIVGTETITINVLSKPSAPALSVVQPSGANSCLATLSCTNAGSNSILWWPTTGILGDHTVLSDIEIVAKPLHPTSYSSTLINSSGCFNEMQATEIAFSNKKLNIGAITQPCYGQDVTLSVTDNNCSTSCAYKWTSSSGQSGTGTSFAISNIDKTATVFVERTDNAVCVEGASKTVKVNPEFDSFQREFSSCEDECIRLKFQMKNSGTFCYDWGNAVISTAASGATAVLQGWMVSGETCNGNNPSSSSPQVAFKATDIGNNTTAVFTVTVNVHEDVCTTACYNQAVFTITVSKPPTLSITPQPVQYCTGGFGAAAINLPAGSKVVFMDGADLDQTTSNEVMASPAGGSKTYEFTVINEAGCCTHGYEIEFEEVEDCCNSGDGELYTYMNPTSQTLLYNLALKGLNADWNTGIIDFTTLGKELAINGNLTLYSSLGFVKAADITLANDAAIHLNGKTLTLNRSSLYSCDGTNMWAGIDNNGNTGSKLVITGTSTDYSKIKEAITAVKFNNGGEVQIEFGEFDNNWIDVSVNNFCNGLSSGSYIRASKFLNTAGTGLKAPHNGQQKNTAIFFYKTDGGTIGSISTDPNVFDRGDYGFQITKSKITLLNNDFSNFTNSGSGYAIYASNELSGSGDCAGTAAFIKLEDGTSAGANSFASSDYGIFSKSHKLTIDNNNFTGIPRAVYVEGSTGKPLVIQNNVLSETQFGISLLQTLASSITVSDNTIELSGLGSTLEYYGIKQEDNVTGPPSVIENNVVSIEDNANCSGIFVRSSSGVQLSHNTVYWNFSGTCGSPCPNVHGLRLEDASGCILDCNHVSGNSTIGSYIEGKRGISLSYSPSCTLTCNNTDKTKSGLEFLADCNNAVIKGNTLNAHKYGLLLGYQNISGTVVEGVIGDQLVSSGIAPANRYQGNNNSSNFLGSGYGLYRYLDNGSNPPIISFHFISNTTIDFYSTSSASNKPGGAIQQGLQSATAFDCDEDCESTLREGDVDTVVDSIIVGYETVIGDTALPGSTYEATIWNMQKNVYEVVVDQPALQDSSVAIAGFVEEKQSDVIGLLVSAEKLMQALTDTTLSVEAFTAKYDSAYKTIELIEPERIFEQNSKNVFSIYLATILTGIDSFTKQQTEMLFEIATQCPYYGGPAVYKARALYSLINDSIVYNDSALCAITEPYIKYQAPSQYSSTIISLELYPNPAYDWLTVSFLIKASANNNLRLVDMYGRTLVERSINKTSGQEVFEVSYLPAGVYQVVLIAEDKILRISKFFKCN